MKAQDKDLKYSLSPSFSFPEWGHSKATISNYSLCRRHNILSCIILIMIWISRMSAFIFCPDFELECIQLCLFGMIKLILCGLSRSTYPQTVTNRLSPRGKLIYFEKKSQTDSKVKKKTAWSRRHRGLWMSSRLIPHFSFSPLHTSLWFNTDMSF